MKAFKIWLANEEVYRHFSTEQLFLTVNEIDTNVIAIQGSNIFPLTYSTLANVNKKNQLN